MQEMASMQSISVKVFPNSSSKSDYTRITIHHQTGVQSGQVSFRPPYLRFEDHWYMIMWRYFFGTNFIGLRSIVFKRCCVTFRALHDPTCPEYVSALLRTPTMTDQHWHLRSSTRLLLYVSPPFKTAKQSERMVTRFESIPLELPHWIRHQGHLLRRFL